MGALYKIALESNNPAASSQYLSTLSTIRPHSGLFPRFNLARHEHGQHAVVHKICFGRRRCSTVNCTGISIANEAAKESSTAVVGVVVVDHGSKRPESNDMLVQFAELYQQVSGRGIVEPAHMEIAEPTIQQAVARCAERGATKIIVAPYFLSRGRHIQQDIPALVSQAQAQLPPGVTCQVADPIGVDPLMAQLIDARVQAAEARGE